MTAREKLNGKARMTPELWVARINAEWRKQVTAIIATGKLLNEAKRALNKHGEWQTLVRKLDFDIRVAQMLMRIANNAVLAKTSNHAFLPPAYNTLYHLTGVAADLQRLIDCGEIHKCMTLADAKALPYQWCLSDNFGKTMAGLMHLMERQCPRPSDEEVGALWYQCAQEVGPGATPTKVREIILPWLVDFFDRAAEQEAERTGRVDHGGRIGLREPREIADPMADATAPPIANN